MRIERVLMVCGAALAGGVAYTLSAGAQSTGVPAVQPLGVPYVSISVLGSDVIVAPERIRFRVTADPGSYLTLIRISAHGRRTVLNPYEKAVDGTRRREILREATTGFENGESYLVAIATRSKFHNANLVRQSEAAAHFANDYFSANGSLDVLLTSVLPSAGDDFSVAYVSFRVLSHSIPMLQYAYRCPISGSYALNGSISGGLYRRVRSGSWLYDDFQDEDRYFNFLDQPYFASACEDRRATSPLFVATLPVPVLPPPPRDTSVTQIDSVPSVGGPTGPIIHNPVAPHPLSVEPLSETIGGGVIPVPDLRRTDPMIAPQMPVQPERIDPVMPLPVSPRIDPVVPVQREPVSEPPVPAEPRAMPAQPMEPPPSPPPAPPPR